MAGEAERVESYLNTIARFEPDLAMTDQDASLTSIAISLKRIADALNTPNEYGEVGSAALARGIKDGLAGR